MRTWTRRGLGITLPGVFSNLVQENTVPRIQQCLPPSERTWESAPSRIERRIARRIPALAGSQDPPRPTDGERSPMPIPPRPSVRLRYIVPEEFVETWLGPDEGDGSHEARPKPCPLLRDESRCRICGVWRYFDRKTRTADQSGQIAAPDAETMSAGPFRGMTNRGRWFPAPRKDQHDPI